jgi:secondary thiamine-phosphate synthase enzyme
LFVTNVHYGASLRSSYTKASTEPTRTATTSAANDDFAAVLRSGGFPETFLNKHGKNRNRGICMADFKIVSTSHSFSTKGEIDFIDLTDMIQAAVAKSNIKNGLVHVFAPHATGILILTENDYGLLEDIKAFLEEIAPKDKAYSHPSNAHAHLRSVLLPPDKTLPVIDGRVGFGTWQSLLFVETDVYPRRRTVIIQVMGEQ